MRDTVRAVRRLIVATVVAALLTGCSYGASRPPPTLAAATQKPFAQVTRVDWSNTTDAVRRDYLTRALADYPGCSVTPDSIINAIWSNYSAEAVPHPPPEQFFREAVAAANCPHRP